MTRRYYVPDIAINGGELRLPDDEAQHAVRVMRVQPEQVITLFDGKGNESEATILSADKRHCVCQAAPPQAVDRESKHAVHLGIALPKPDRARELIERLTELGVASVTPIVANRTQRPPSASLLEKLGRAIVEASKQCGRNRLMEITPPEASRSYFEERRESEFDRWIAHPSGTSMVDATPPERLVAAIGPEGGWTADELQWATASGFTAVGLGKRIYRIETAATLIAARLAD